MQPDSIRQLPEIHSRAPWSQSLPAGPPGDSDLRTKSPPRLVKSRVVNSGAAFRAGDVISATPVCMPGALRMTSASELGAELTRLQRLHAGFARAGHCVASCPGRWGTEQAQFIGTNLGHKPRYSRGGFHPSFASSIALLKIQKDREGRVAACTRGPRAKGICASA